MHHDRRRFISRTLHSMLGASVYSALGGLQLVQAAAHSASAKAAYSFSDYKALICVFQYGGSEKETPFQLPAARSTTRCARRSRSRRTSCWR